MESMLNENKIIEDKSREQQEINFFSNLLKFQGIKNVFIDGSNVEDLNKSLKNKIKDNCINVLLNPSKDNLELIKPIRKCLVNSIFQEKSEQEKGDLELILDEIISNVFLHSSADSKYALLSLDLEKGQIITMNFSSVKLPEKTLKFIEGLNKNKEKAIEEYLNSDLKNINNNCQKNEVNEEDMEELCHQRGLEIVSKLVKNVRYEEVEEKNLGFCHKFTFEI